MDWGLQSGGVRWMGQLPAVHQHLCGSAAHRNLTLRRERFYFETLLLVSLTLAVVEFVRFS